MKKPIRKDQKKYFYEHIVTHESIVLEIDTLEMSTTERWHLVSLVESMLHNAILDTVLSRLQPEDKKVFLHHVVSQDHESVWQLLHEKAAGVEKHITQTAHEVFSQLRRDIHEARLKQK